MSDGLMMLLSILEATSTWSKPGLAFYGYLLHQTSIYPDRVYVPRAW
jgi:hypothetical protein